MKTTAPQFHHLTWLALAGLALLAFTCMQSHASYPDPAGGWTYKYNGNQLIVDADASAFTSLDGTWSHNNGSDQWDGSIIGGTFATGGYRVGNGPGGTILLTNSGAEFLRLQDTGDPTDYGYPDPSNRKIYFGRTLDSDGVDPTKALTIMSSGITLTFRARIPTLAKAGPPLDPLHRDGQQANGVQPYPENGDGYVTSDGGKGNFVIRQAGNGADVPAGAIAFSFTQTTDTTGGNPTANPAGFAGLTFNEFNGNVPSASVNFGQGSKTNVVAFDPTDWHEIYIVIRKDPASIGTHEAFIFRDDGLLPVVYKITAGTGNDYGGSYLAFGGTATPQNWALDVDWVGYKDEAVFPPGALLPPSLFGFVPQDRTSFHPIASNISFSVSALMPTNRLPASGIKMILNGQDVSSQLSLTGNDQSASRTATFSGLQPNTEYSATYIVTDSGGLSSTNDLTFDTFVESTATLIEAEDYNMFNGQFFDDPYPGLYIGQTGTEGVDYFDTSPNSLGAYRTSDAVDTATSTDAPRARFVDAFATDYMITTIGRGEWWNYTRTLTNSTYHAWIRAASTSAQAVRLDRVIGDTGIANQTLQLLGIFAVPATGSLNRFAYVPLTDIQGRPIVIKGGTTNTLRLTATGANNNLALNFLLLQPASGNPAEPLVSVSPLPGAVGVIADASVEAVIYDGSNPVDQGTVKLRVGGAEVPATVTKSGSLTTIKHTPTSLWSPGSTQNLNITFNDGTSRSYDWSFTTVNYPVLTPAMKVTNATIPGFVWRVHQNETNTEGNIQKVVNTLSGALGLPNLADPNSMGPASGPGTPSSPGTGMMTFNVPTVINLGQDTFANAGNFVPDEQMPGIPGLNGSNDGIAVEINTFIEFPQGFVTMGVTSDDGFRTTAGFVNDRPLLLDQFDATRSATENAFQFAVLEAGVYAFRTLYYEGTSNASIEWYIVKPDGTRVLINDTANGGPVAYQQGTIPTAPPIGDVTISASLNSSGKVVLQWSTGTLLSADDVDGPYLPVVGASSPQVVDPADAVRKFYRILVQ